MTAPAPAAPNALDAADLITRLLASSTTVAALRDASVGTAAALAATSLAFSLAFSASSVTCSVTCGSGGIIEGGGGGGGGGGGAIPIHAFILSASFVGSGGGGGGGGGGCCRLTAASTLSLALPAHSLHVHVVRVEAAPEANGSPPSSPSTTGFLLLQSPSAAAAAAAAAAGMRLFPSSEPTFSSTKNPQQQQRRSSRRAKAKPKPAKQSGGLWPSLPAPAPAPGLVPPRTAAAAAPSTRAAPPTAIQILAIFPPVARGAMDAMTTTTTTTTTALTTLTVALATVAAFAAGSAFTVGAAAWRDRRRRRENDDDDDDEDVNVTLTEEDVNPPCNDSTSFSAPPPAMQPQPPQGLSQLSQTHPSRRRAETAPAPQVVSSNSLRPLEVVGGHASKNLGPAMLKLGGYVYKPFQAASEGRSSAKTRGDLEADFYLHVTQLDHPLLDFVPAYFGIQKLDDGNTYLVLEDLTSGMDKPCVLDLKMGRRAYDENASPEKVAKEKKKYPPQESVGFRFSGMRVFQAVTREYVESTREWCLSLEPTQIADALERFFFDGNAVRHALVRSTVAQLKDLVRVLEDHPRWRMYGASVLVVYDGADPNATDVVVRLIDFAHTYEIKDEGGKDHGFLTGLYFLLSALNNILDRHRRGRRASVVDQMASAIRLLSQQQAAASLVGGEPAGVVAPGLVAKDEPAVVVVVDASAASALPAALARAVSSSSAVVSADASPTHSIGGGNAANTNGGSDMPPRPPSVAPPTLPIVVAKPLDEQVHVVDSAAVIEDPHLAPVFRHMQRKIASSRELVSRATSSASVRSLHSVVTPVGATATPQPSPWISAAVATAAASEDAVAAADDSSTIVGDVPSPAHALSVADSVGRGGVSPALGGHARFESMDMTEMAKTERDAGALEREVAFYISAANDPLGRTLQPMLRVEGEPGSRRLVFEAITELVALDEDHDPERVAAAAAAAHAAAAAASAAPLPRLSRAELAALDIGEGRDAYFADGSDDSPGTPPTSSSARVRGGALPTSLAATTTTAVSDAASDADADPDNADNASISEESVEELTFPRALPPAIRTTSNASTTANQAHVYALKIKLGHRSFNPTNTSTLPTKTIFEEYVADFERPLGKPMCDRVWASLGLAPASEELSARDLCAFRDAATTSRTRACRIVSSSIPSSFSSSETTATATGTSKPPSFTDADIESALDAFCRGPHGFDAELTATLIEELQLIRDAAMESPLFSSLSFIGVSVVAVHRGGLPAAVRLVDFGEVEDRPRTDADNDNGFLDALDWLCDVMEQLILQSREREPDRTATRTTAAASTNSTHNSPSPPEERKRRFSL